MRRMILGMALAAVVTAPVSAETFGHSRKDRMVINTGFNGMADFCARDLGFTRVEKKPDAVLVDKMEAYLLLAPTVDSVLFDWGHIIQNAHEMDRAAKDEAFAERLADFLIAAEKDPDSYARAEAMYVSAMKDKVEVVVGACRAMANDAFLGANYLTGNGSADRYDEHLKELFAEGVKK